MKFLKSVPSAAASRRLVFARVAVGLSVTVAVAIALAPPVTDSVALDLTSATLGAIDGRGEPPVIQGIDVEQTVASPTEPLSISY